MKRSGTWTVATVLLVLTSGCAGLLVLACLRPTTLVWVLIRLILAMTAGGLARLTFSCFRLEFRSVESEPRAQSQQLEK